jgi:hypothetical protein
MKTVYSIACLIGRAAVFFLVLIIFSFGNLNNPPISYIESSGGLQSIALESGRTEVEMADINKDGYIDFLSVGDHGSPFINTQEHGVMVWFGNGTGGNWSLFQYGNFGYGGIAIGDVNNDGNPDVGYGIHHDYSTTDLGDQILEVALGNGTGMNWTAWDDSLASQGETWGMFSTDFADVDNDGWLDIGSVSFGCCAGVHVYKNMTVGKWRQTFGFTGGNSNMEFVFGDINNDGNMDFAVAQQYGAPYFGDGNGGFVLKHNNLPAPGNTGFRSVALGDVNNDGGKELAFIVSSGGAVNVWSWNIGTQNWDNFSSGLPSSSSFSGIQLCDMNVDGYADVIAFGNGNLTIWGSSGGTNWTQLLSFTTPTPGSYSDFTVGGDADHNGYPDIVIEAEEGTWPNELNKLRFFKETTPYTTLSITPVYPRGFERIKNNRVVFVDWVSAAPPSQVTKVKLEFSSTGNSGPWILIADSLPNNGRYQWQAPASVNSEQCFIRHTVFIPGGGSAASVTPNRFIVGNLVGVETHNLAPKQFKLYQNFPNPFNPVTKIKLDIPSNVKWQTSNVNLVVYNALGKEIKTLVNGSATGGLPPGTHEVEFDGSDLPSSVYFYKLQTENFRDVKRMVLIK